jgi:hypothetical protein
MVEAVGQLFRHFCRAGLYHHLGYATRGSMSRGERIMEEVVKAYVASILVLHSFP